MGRQKIEVKTGDKYGRLTIVKEVEPIFSPCGKMDRMFLCSCSCGIEKVIRFNSLRKQETISCGCYRIEMGKKNFVKVIPSHGFYNHYLYATWFNMKRRCFDSNHIFYKNYGGRGIKVCDRWLESFNNFLEDMGERPDGYTLDRINNDGNYEPSNCRWATRTEQSNNKRKNTKSVKS